MKNKMGILQIVTSVIFTASISIPVNARQVAAPDNVYEKPTPVSETAQPQETIQTAGDKSAKKNNTGKLMGMAAIGVTTIGVATTCFTKPPSPKCPYFVAGLAASVVVTKMMSKSKKKSEETVAAVSTGAVDGGASQAGYNSDYDYMQTPEWKAAQDNIARLESQGFKFDQERGIVTDPTGKTFSAQTFSSPESMKAAGFSGSQIQGFMAEKAKTEQAINAKVAAAADGTDMFGGEIGGSGGSGGTISSASSADGAYGTGVGGAGLNGKNSGLGIDRDPAQVAGMSKNLGNDRIGVSGDSLFDMIDRRYELHNKNGSFLPGP